MTSRDRVLSALNLRKPDRTPRLLYEELIGYTPAIESLLNGKCAPKIPREYFNMDMTSVVPNPTRLLCERFSRWLPQEVPRSAKSLTDFSQNYDTSSPIPVDEWGVWWQQGGFHHFAHIESPLAHIGDFNEIKEFPWPDLDQPYRYFGVAKNVFSLHNQGMAVASFVGSIFEQAWYIRGMEKLFEDMILNPEIAHYLFDHTAYYQKSVAYEMAKAGVDLIILGDDVAMQTGLMMSVETWRTFLKPRLEATITAVKQVRPETKILYHSDGNIKPLISELIQIGVEVLNPVQPECMDPAEIKTKYGNKLAFLGTVSVQKTMPLGTPQDVRNEIKKRIQTVGYNGGLILAPAHVLGPEVPWENIVAFFENSELSL